MANPDQSPIAKHNRFLFLDALRGFDMLLISGAGSFIVLLHGKTRWGWVDWIADQFRHPAWHGFTFYDFIFPLFLFIAGVSLSISLRRLQEKNWSNKQIIQKVFWRMLILIALGIAYKNAPIPFHTPSDIRFGSVLGRIGFATFASTLIYLYFSRRALIAWIFSILAVYYALLFLVPVPGYGAGDLSFEGNLVGWIDRAIMPGRLLQGTYDELAILTQFPALCLTLFGLGAGEELLGRGHNPQRQSWRGAGIGAILIGLGLLWHLHFPINKHLWSSSFILLTAGMSYIFLYAFYWLIEVKEYRSWAFFFKVIGVNSLLIYLVYRFIDFKQTSDLLFGGVIAFFADPWHNVLQALGALLLVWLFLFFCDRQKIYLKI